MGHLVHGGNQANPIGLAFGTFLLKEGLEEIGVKYRDRAGVVQPCTQNLVAAFTDISLAFDTGTGLMHAGILVDADNALRW